MHQPKLPVQQLLILSICRFAEPIVFTSILPYLPELVEYVGVPRNEVAKWVGICSAVASLSQALMAVPWGTASDRVGRKPVILFGLTCTMVCSIMFGMSQSLTMVLISRMMLGLMNGNVGILRTMVAEMVPERELQPRAFSILPLVWTVGSIFGPAFGGMLARPAEKHPALFGDSWFLRRFPFALPNLAAACFFIIGITTGFLFLRETLETQKDRRDYGLFLGKAITRSCLSRKHQDSGPVTSDERASLLPENGQPPRKKKPVRQPSWSQVFTPQSNLVLLAYSLLAMHSMAFDSVFPVFLHYPVQEFEGNPDVQLPFKFAGGFGVDAQTIGLFYTIIGTTGMVIQFLCFPPIATRYGVLKCLKVSVIILPLTYLITPFTALVPVTLRIPTVLSIMLVRLSAGIFGVPCCTILLTNSASTLTVLGTLNGVATTFSAVGRAAGPALTGAAFSFGVSRGYVVFPWWVLALLAALSAVPVFWLVEMEGPKREDNYDYDDDDEVYDDHDYDVRTGVEVR
ncbi:permease of the major facilitator superfamily, partial [Penicillium alfredii]